jgi:hypothetical protein
MPQTATLPVGGGGGIEGMSLPVKLGLIGGGLGLAFFLWRKVSSPGGVENSSSDNTFGIPNTAIMLGSMQQQLLDLKGEVGSGNATLGEMVTGGFENMGAQIDAQTAAIQAGLGTVQDAIIFNQNANTHSILDSLSQRTDLLGKLIADNHEAEMAVNKSFAASLVAGLDSITALHNAQLAAIGAMGTNITAGQTAIINQLNQLTDATAGNTAELGNQRSVINQLIASVELASSKVAAGIGGAKAPQIAQAFNNRLVFSTTDQNYYYSNGGFIYRVNYWFAIRHFSMDKLIKTDLSMSNFWSAELQDEGGPTST